MTSSAMVINNCTIATRSYLPGHRQPWKFTASCQLAPLIPTPSRPPPKRHSCHHCTMAVANTKTDEVASPISLPRLFVSFSTTTTTTVAGHRVLPPLTVTIPKAPQLIVHVLCLCIVIWKRKGKLLEEVELLMLRKFNGSSKLVII